MNILCICLMVDSSYPVLAFKDSKVSPLKYLKAYVLTTQPMLSVYSNDEFADDFEICTTSQTPLFVLKIVSVISVIMMLTDGEWRRH